MWRSFKTKIRILLFLLTSLGVQGWGQEPGAGEGFIISAINISGTELSNAYVRRLLTFREGDSFTPKSLEAAFERSRVIAQDDDSIYFAEFSYTVANGEAVVELIVYDNILPTSFGAFDTGPIVTLRNLLGEGVDVGVHLGFSRQMLELDWKRIGGAPVGFSFLTGHRIFNAFESDYRTFSLGSTNRLYVWLGNHTRLGLLNDVFFNFGGWDEARGRSAGLGGFLSMDHYYLAELYGIGFSMDAEYLYFLQDISNAHKLYLRGKVYLRPFNTNKIVFHLDTRWHWSNGDLSQRGKNALSHNSGRTAWDAGLYLPVHLLKLTGGANFYLGLEPGVLIGNGGTDEFDFNNPDVGLSLAPFLQVGFPASVYFSTRFIYNLSEQRLSFTIGFYSLPYTRQVDMDW
ncbi:MAG: hypothetical protein B0D92_04110 [Spirochaeta sp. LUC14_002_19_P3]|nr:MAG: hypothetical protein B0D92_04110 [Spirochaeta sp. LUC14_002_19_P3]